MRQEKSPQVIFENCKAVVIVKGFVLFLTTIYEFYKLFPRYQCACEAWPMGSWKDGD